MIHLTRINNSSLILNADLIEHIQETPDTVISLTSGRNYLVMESAEEVIRRVIAWRREVMAKASDILTSRTEVSGGQ